MSDTSVLADVGARHGHFRLESGHHSDLWLDLETLLLHPRRIRPLAARLAAALEAHRADCICGALVEGAFVALLVAEALDVEFVYAERFATSDRDALFPVDYRLPSTLRPIVRGRRVAIVNDVISAGSAVRGTWADLQACEAEVVAIGALLVLGSAVRAVATERRTPLETIAEAPHNLWTPDACPLCAARVPLSVGA